MITKNDIKKELDNYDNQRSLLNSGPFLYAIDYFTTPLYYQIKNFYNGLSKHNLGEEELSPTEIKKLQALLIEYNVKKNSINNAIFALHYNLYHMANISDYDKRERVNNT